MGALKLESFFLDKQRPIKSHGENTCVLDYVWDQCKSKFEFKTYTYDRLKEEMKEYAADFPKMSTQELIEWAKTCHGKISILAYDATYRKFMKHISLHPDISLVYFVKDHHCYPITHERLKIIASKANQGGANDLWKYMSDLKWSRRHKRFTVMKSLEEEEELDTKNHVIVLPEDTKMEHAIDQYTGRTNYFVEYLHFDSKGVLDGFTDHRNNMSVLNNDYDIRNSICNTLYTPNSKMAVARIDLGKAAWKRGIEGRRQDHSVFTYDNRVRSCLKIALFHTVLRKCMRKMA